MISSQRSGPPARATYPHELPAGPTFAGVAIRILIVDNIEGWHCVCIEVLRRRRPDWEIVGAAGDAVDAIQKSSQLKPDVVLLDMDLGPTDGIETARRIIDVSPASRILFMSNEAPSPLLENALSTGAYGYIAKRNVVLDLVSAVEAVAQGKRFLSPTKS